MGAFFFGEFEKDLFALGVFEALAVLLEELVGIALAADANEQRLQIIHAGAQFFGSFREDAVGGAFEKQKGRTRLEQRILGDELAISAFERAEMFLLLGGEPFEHG